MSKQKFSFQNANSNPDFQGVQDVTAEDLLAALSSKTAPLFLIDVRQPDEYTGELGHIDGAKLIPLGTLPQSISSISQDQTIVFVCRSGGRSAKASAFALESGLSAVYNLRGGMLRWNQLGFETKK